MRGQGAMKQRILCLDIPRRHMYMVIATTLSVHCFALLNCSANHTSAKCCPEFLRVVAIECLLDCLGQLCPLPTARASPQPCTRGVCACARNLATTAYATVTVCGTLVDLPCTATKIYSSKSVAMGQKEIPKDTGILQAMPGPSLHVSNLGSLAC